MKNTLLLLDNLSQGRCIPIYKGKLPMDVTIEDFFRLMDISRYEVDLKMILMNLPHIISWLKNKKNFLPLSEAKNQVPIIWYDQVINFDKILIHYDGSENSALIIHHFMEEMKEQLSNSSVTIISPRSLPKYRLADEQALVKSIQEYAKETSFIKLNFSKIGEFWSYAIKHDFKLLLTSKSYQDDLLKMMMHFDNQGIWGKRLSFYLG
ncbi:hypothetical protein GCM10007049_03340 [Echinicola pacifica]|uniref:Uncharacterized protein n=1 Tax=Echinicola pacifica TaxID=346377 RepID=A0A918PKZ3_9BACT|nr:hypothetical protein [Echinicola pacifica]GGZ14732.1 hypothetical protein GCM10007049_03340 [Echinicola pacifica]